MQEVSINSPSGEGGEDFFLLFINGEEKSVMFPLILLQAKAVSQKNLSTSLCLEQREGFH